MLIKSNMYAVKIRKYSAHFLNSFFTTYRHLSNYDEIVIDYAKPRQAQRQKYGAPSENQTHNGVLT